MCGIFQKELLNKKSGAHFYAPLLYKKTALTSKTVCCLKVTKRSRIEVKVSKSSVSAPFERLEFVGPLTYLMSCISNS